MRKSYLKRIIALTCASAMILSGCGGQGKNKVDNTVEDRTNLVIMVQDNGYGTEFVTELAKAFEAKNEGVKVKVEVVPNASAKIAETIKNWKNNDIDIYFNVNPSVMAEQVRYSWDGKNALREMNYLYDSQIPGEEQAAGCLICSGLLGCAILVSRLVCLERLHPRGVQ